MDYGYQLLRHVLQQVFGNLEQAARLTLALFLVPFVAFIALGGGAPMGGMMSGGSLLGLLITVIAMVFAYGWAAVGWHRFVLLEEYGTGFVPVWRRDRVLAYLGRVILVGLVVIAAVLGGGIVVGIVAGVTQSVALAVVMGIGLVLFASWVATRIGLVLPAAALGTSMKIGESWAITRPVSAQILLPLIVIALVAGLLQQLLLVLFGQTVTVQTFGMMQQQVVLSLPGQILGGLLSWLQILVNLALMTTLYGNLVEGRQLN